MQESPDNVQIFRIIGEGMTSQVMECKINSKNYAMKVFKPMIDYQTRINEISILKTLSHPNILDYIIEDSPDKPEWFVVEILQDKDLFDYIAIIDQPFDEKISHYIFKKLVSATSLIHSSGYVHRDLKLENILLHPISNQVKICDFGFSQKTNTSGQRGIGTKGYMAPELFCTFYCDDTIDGEELIKADLFGLGVILFVMIFGFPPFTSTNIKDNCPLWRAINIQRWPLFWKTIFKRGKTIQRELQELLEGLLCSTVVERFSEFQIQENQWFQQDSVSDDVYSNEINFRKSLM